MNGQAELIHESLFEALKGFGETCALRLNEFWREKDKGYKASTLHHQAEKTCAALVNAFLAMKLLIDARSQIVSSQAAQRQIYMGMGEKLFSLDSGSGDPGLDELIAAGDRNFIDVVHSVSGVQQAVRNLTDFWCVQVLAAGWSIMDDKDHLTLRVLWEELYKSAVDVTAGALLLPVIPLGDLQVGPEIYVPIFRAVQACTQAYAKQSQRADEMLARSETLELRSNAWAEETTKLASLLNRFATASA